MKYLIVVVGLSNTVGAELSWAGGHLWHTKNEAKPITFSIPYFNACCIYLYRTYDKMTYYVTSMIFIGHIVSNICLQIAINFYHVNHCCKYFDTHVVNSFFPMKQSSTWQHNKTASLLSSTASLSCVLKNKGHVIKSNCIHYVIVNVQVSNMWFHKKIENIESIIIMK